MTDRARAAAHRRLNIATGMLAFGEPADVQRIACLTLIVTGMVGLKLITPQ